MQGVNYSFGVACGEKSSSGLLTFSAANEEHIRELERYLAGFAEQLNCANVTDLFEKLREQNFRVGFLHGSGIKGPEDAEFIAAQKRYQKIIHNYSPQRINHPNITPVPTSSAVAEKHLVRNS